MAMYLRLVMNDVRASKGISAAVASCVAVSALLLSLALILSVSLAGALDALMARARTPHFMQMHVPASSDDWAREEAALEGFAAEYPGLSGYQVSAFLNLGGDLFRFEGGSLAASVQDNGLVVQNPDFDFLLDLEGDVILPRRGELWVPLCYADGKPFCRGSLVSIAGHPFVVAGFMRDSQMNAPLSSSKRFLVHEEDFGILSGSGRIEYLISFRLDDKTSLSVFGEAYTSHGLPANGPTLTWPLFRMINAVADGILASVLFLLALVLVSISLLCIRFTLMARLEDDYREIGTLKALGLPLALVKRIYLAKYAFLVFLGAVVGLVASLPLSQPLLFALRRSMGGFGAKGAIASAVFGVTVLAFLVIFFVHVALGRFRSIPCARAVRTGFPESGRAGGRWFTLSRFGVLSRMLFLGVKEVLAQKRLYASLFIMYALSAFVLLVPWNLHRSIAHPSFIRYMGLGASDLRFDLGAGFAGESAYASGQKTRTDELLSFLEDSLEVARAGLFETRLLRVFDAQGLPLGIKAESGDHRLFPLSYVEGRAPSAPGDIALSVLLAQESGYTLGSRIPLSGESGIAGVTTLIVCGIYSDITNGGKTAKCAISLSDGPVLWQVIPVALRDPDRAPSLVEQWSRLFPATRLVSVNEFISQTFGPTIAAVQRAALGTAGAVFVISFLVTLLCLRVIVGKDRRDLALLRAAGFPLIALVGQYLVRLIMLVLPALVLGAVLAATLGETMAGGFLSLFGAVSFSFVPISPFMLIVLPAFTVLPAALAVFAVGPVLGAAETLRAVRS